ncbi:zona pellucida-binding protein 1 [Cuculus canorus]|uniref:zona pellucida-binding protein 1 n=1 Tax=Cuculus canorus TaxID=55661 RepID=UPI0023AB0E57|nr:zona pellucida-binding protein 1 [Cuculus canorus]
MKANGILESIERSKQIDGDYPFPLLCPKSSSVQIPLKGTLILRHFTLSGVYTCSIVYQLAAMQSDKSIVIIVINPANLLLNCLVRLHKLECIHVKMKRCLQNAIFFTFSDQNLIEKFFKQQVESNRHTSEPLAETLYKIVLGCNPVKSAKVTCTRSVVYAPGLYNPSDRIHCLQCSLIYGETKC